MTNNTTTNETTNLTTELGEAESGMLEGLMDMLLGSPELMVAVAVIGALVAYIAYTQPAVMALVYKFGGSYIKSHEGELNTILDKYLTKAQMTAYTKLDEAAQKHVKDVMLRNVILSAWDQNDDKFVAVVKAEAKEAMASAKQL